MTAGATNLPPMRAVFALYLIVLVAGIALYVAIGLTG